MAPRRPPSGKKPAGKKPLFTGRRIASLAGWGAVAFFLLIIYFGYNLPSTDDVKPIEMSPGITVLANDGTVLARYGGLKGDLLTVADLPPYVPQAFVAIEDRRFYHHFGIDLLGLTRAMWENLKAGHFVQGGSTITQQLAKNLFLTPDKTIRRKVQEALLALQIERRYTKDEILSAYLNRVYFGDGAYGIDAAARVYFGKSARSLTLWQGAVLAGLLKAPSRFSPASNPILAAKRARVVLGAMEDSGFISKAKMKSAISSVDLGMKKEDTGDDNRYFTDWVVNQIDSFVSNTDRNLVVRTTLDPALQTAALAKEKALFKTLTPQNKVSQMALVTLSKNGAVLAMIGGTDYAKSQFNRAVQAERQPGSSFKPFVYLAALEAGFSPTDTIEDAPITTGDYHPQNYDKYYGTVTLTDALALSLNTATIRLLMAVGLPRLLDVTSRFGFSHPFKADLSTGLGAGSASVLEMTNAYAMIANGGYATYPYAILSIEDANGDVLYQNEGIDHPRLFSARNMAALNDMLQQVVIRGTGQAAALPGLHVAGKTGTSQDYRDAWFVGYTDKLVTGVWMGNDDDSPMARVTGGRYPAQLWHNYMQDAVTENLPDFATRTVTEKAAGPSAAFSDMLNYWSSGAQGLHPDNVPVYNQ